MTTMEIDTALDLVPALEAAGVGGVIVRHMDSGSRDSTEYHVDQDDQGRWIMATSNGNGSLGRAVVAEGYYVNDGWRVHTVGTPIAEGSWAALLRGLAIGTYLTDGYSQYLFGGWGQSITPDAEGNTERVALVLDARHWDVFEWNPTALATQCSWTVVTEAATDDLSDEPTQVNKVADRVLLRAMDRIKSQRADLALFRRAADQNAEELGKALQDFRAINVHINSYADEMSMCPDYERRIFSWNDGVNGQQALHNKLEGRRKTHTIYMSVPALSTEEMWVQVEATSPQRAQEMVDNMSKQELFAALAASAGRRGLNLEYTVNRVVL